MKIAQLNRRYFYFQLTDAELKDRTRCLAFLANIQNEIPGDHRGKLTMRFFLRKYNYYCIHKSKWEIFATLVREYFGVQVKSPFIQEEML